ncbi:beta-galactoside alpha-2,6-sialyltransferase 2-like [Ptychodera flava]|uniref:beta-galactoside alpha-2,6-sialyltransferase 2-like n=1 Tax=Ptychodera flava TaxID=63121 RepID=UPI003969BD84
MLKDTTLVIWKTTGGIYNGNLYQWMKRSKTFITAYLKWTSDHPNNPMYVVNPVSLWRGWDVIQEFYNEPLPPHTPSSGFVGVLLMLPQCEEIDVYGYVRPNWKDHITCHYFAEKCPPQPKQTYHPVRAERHLLLKMNSGDLAEVKNKGRVSLPGFSNVTCV